jgi:transcriptional antiterminator RfaH
MMAQQDSRWIAVYSRARFERVLARYLQQRGLTSFVPLRRCLHRWSDRFKWVEEPLLPSYVFVFLASTQHEHLFDAPGAIRIVNFRGRVAVVRPEEIEFLRRVEGHPGAEGVAGRFQRGRYVKIVRGVFEGYSGIIANIGEQYCTVAVGIEELSYAVQVKVSRADVEAVETGVGPT